MPVCGEPFMNYEIDDIDALGRIGKLDVNNKQLITPNLLPVVYPYKNVIPPSELKKFGAQCIFTNSYIIYQNDKIREDVLKKKLHQYLNFDGLIATDSGAYQQYMYNKVKVDINAKEIETFQEKIASDFPVILDVPVQPDDDYETAKEKVNMTIKRAKDNINRRTNRSCHWFGPIHGAKYLDLLKLSSTEMNNLDFDFYAIGGLVKLFLNYRFDLVIKILLTVKENIRPDKPIHMFGLGLPQFFSLAVACGCDLMDSAAYILFAKEYRYFTLSTGTKKLEELDEFPCHCPICCDYSPAEIKSMDDNIKIELLARHNLYLSFSELRTIRQAIREGKLWELVHQRIHTHPNLVKAVKLIKNFKNLFEKHEKVYKKHGRLYVSPESIDRPLLDRYLIRLKTNYRVPKEAKNLIILPELDTRCENSPTIMNWLNYLNNNEIISRNLIHIVFFTQIYGILPYELTSTYPMGQYETITSSNKNNEIYQNSLIMANKFFNIHSKHYKKCGVLIPEIYLNQYGEDEKISENNPIHDLKPSLLSKSAINYLISNNLEVLLMFFKGDT